MIPWLIMTDHDCHGCMLLVDCSFFWLGLASSECWKAGYNVLHSCSWTGKPPCWAQVNVVPTVRLYRMSRCFVGRAQYVSFEDNFDDNGLNVQRYVHCLWCCSNLHFFVIQRGSPYEARKKTRTFLSLGQGYEDVLSRDLRQQPGRFAWLGSSLWSS